MTNRATPITCNKVENTPDVAAVSNRNCTSLTLRPTIVMVYLAVKDKAWDVDKKAILETASMSVFRMVETVWAKATFRFGSVTTVAERPPTAWDRVTTSWVAPVGVG